MGLDQHIPADTRNVPGGRDTALRPWRHGSAVLDAAVVCRWGLRDYHTVVFSCLRPGDARGKAATANQVAVGRLWGGPAWGGAGASCLRPLLHRPRRGVL